MENQAYVLALNRSGSDFNKIFAEQSLIIDPWGNIVVKPAKERTPYRYPGPLKSNGSM
ncbi:nitrilase-related carbon-nitrogen hydrolase [Peribacillus butanolivorans]|uniref:nitrilase-related carbon-nitrogen hydrolase n=1 Tax=Peribacillus butanolivorans TaxID=421767 RepID=UPI003D2B82EB